MEISTLGLFAMQFAGAPYEWAGNGPFSFDCSGFVQKVLREFDSSMYDERDRTAQGIFEYFRDLGHSSGLGRDSLLFFGQSQNNITHVAIALSDTLMIEAGGGDSTCRTKEDATQCDGRVRVSWISSRRDLVAAVKVFE
jgi:cell wall-associated NlpC family hydrolase